MTGGRKPWHRSRLVRALVALVVAGVLAGVTQILVAQDRLESVRAQAFDRLYPSGEASPDVVVVGIDRRSIAGLDEPWPWTREVHAAMLSNLDSAGAEVVVFDIVFDFPGEGDQAFAEAIAAHGQTVLGVDVDEARHDPDSDLLTVQRSRSPIPAFSDAAAATAHVMASPDRADGVVRRLPLLVETPERRLIPSLALAATALAEGADPSVITLRNDGVQVGTASHPTERSRHLRVNWAAGLDGPPPAGEPEPSADDRYLSAVDVARGDFDAATVEGRIVLIGATDPLLGDNVLTPVQKAGMGTPGVYAHANAVSTMLTGQYRSPPSDAGAVVAAGVLAGLLALIALLAPLWVAPVAGALLAGGHLLLVSIRFDTGRTTDIVLPLLSLALAGVAGVGFRYVTESRERRTVSTLFSQYVPKDVAKQLLEQGRAVDAAEGQRLEITVFFCDLRGFTSLASVREPVEVRDMLSIYYEYGTRLVLEHGGTLMQYVGDEIFAVFGAPLPTEDHAQRALDCAIAMQAAADDMADDLAAKGLPRLAYGIGLNTGPVVAAHMGGGLRRQYGVIGDTVNVGARLCALAQPGEITLPEMVRRRLDDVPELEPLGGVRLKGVTEDPEVQRVKLPGLPPLAERPDAEDEKATVISVSSADEPASTP